MSLGSAPAPSLFERFNARQLHPEEVARFFVPPDQYWDLLTVGHSVLIGPRGSGKTTLLKMLHPSAVCSWRHAKRAQVRNRLTYSTVLVPTDIAWKQQIDAFADGLSDEHADLIVTAAFSAHVLRAFAGSVRERLAPPHFDDEPFRPLVMTRGEEAVTAARIGEIWGVDPALDSFRALEEGMRDRIRAIEAVASQERALGTDGRSQRLAAANVLHHDLLTSISQALDQIEEFEPDRHHCKWAVLFDELELAPRVLQRRIFGWMRSTDDRLLLKLSLSPYAEELKDVHLAPGPSASNDYTPIILTYPTKQKGYPFCRQLLAELLDAEGLPQRSPTEIFGPSVFDLGLTDSGGRVRGYKIGTDAQARFERMSQVDPSFASYLAKNRLDPRRLDELPDTQRAAKVRKVTTVLAVREYFRSFPEDHDVPDDPRVRRRSRRAREIYCGGLALFAMVEGNPRLFIGIIGRLIRRYRDQLAETERPRSPSQPIIPANVQSREILATSERFRALLNTIAAPDVVTPRGKGSAAALVDRMGDFIQAQVTSREFKSDPRGTFEVDVASAPFAPALAQALNAGALIYVPRAGEEDVLVSMFDHRYRLSYLLAPYYKIPILLLKQVTLSRVLATHARSTDRRATADETQDQNEEQPSLPLDT